jgi:N-acetyl sugar amidotransferase
MGQHRDRKELVNNRLFGSQDSEDRDEYEALYGLPRDVKFCTNCVISNQRPNSTVEFLNKPDSLKETIHFDKDGLCDACKLTRKKRVEVDWNDRELELRELCEKYRKHGHGYDCLVPGSGGKDSFYTAHRLKYKYGMNPLTVTWAPHLYTDWGWSNFQAWIKAGFDNYLMTPNARVHRLITRLALENLFHPFQPFMLGQKSLAPKLAGQFDIPLVFYGENEAEYGNPIQDTDSAKRDWIYFTLNEYAETYLGGVSLEELQTEFGLKPVDLEPYIPINPETVVDKGIEVHYLGYYEQWHPQGAYYYAVENGEFQASPERTPGTYSKYNSIDDKMDDFHYYTTYIKFGIGRATYDASQEIRNDEIARDEGIALVKKFDGEFPSRFEQEIYEYLGIPESQFPRASHKFEQPIIDRDYFMALADSFRSPHLWKHQENKWTLRWSVF